VLRDASRRQGDARRIREKAELMMMADGLYKLGESGEYLLELQHNHVSVFLGIAVGIRPGLRRFISTPALLKKNLEEGRLDLAGRRISWTPFSEANCFYARLSSLPDDGDRQHLPHTSWRR
jgi:hypothetical protein